MFYRHQHRIVALDIEEGFLLSGKRGIRHIFRRGRGAHGKRCLGVAFRELVIGVMDSVFQLWRERRIDDPLPDLRPGFRQFANVINVRVIQQLIDTLVDAALVKKLIKSIRRGGESVRDRYPCFRQIGDHLTQRGIFSPHAVNIVHTELVIPEHQR